ncbi:hypothetical protein [Streptomyces aureus]|uniref:Uncharacterized protein n=1 Tax=Streptomyces aureus TaxID=193461 RepID=A0ABV4SVN6_9ACTN
MDFPRSAVHEPARSKSAEALGRGVSAQSEGVGDDPGLADRGRLVQAYLARLTSAVAMSQWLSISESAAGCPGMLKCLRFTVLQPRQNSQGLFQGHLMYSGTRHGQFPADGEGFLDGGQCVLAPPHHPQQGGEVVQNAGEVGQERVGTGRSQFPADGRPARSP